MGDHAAKPAPLDSLAEAAEALSSGRRAEVIDVLAQGERSVEVPVDPSGTSRQPDNEHGP